MKVVGLIPVRLESSRLPEKAIKDICGLPMIIHVLKRTQMAKSLAQVFVATDSSQIANLVRLHDGNVIMTGAHHRTGSDRIAEAALKIDADIIVNVQGDEALVNPEHIDMGVQGLIESDAEVSLLVTEFNETNSPSNIKAVLNKKNEIMYLSRADIPSIARSATDCMYKAYHVVTFRKEFLLAYAKMEQTPLELVEFNEYLRILENGYKIQGIKVESKAISVDTSEDLDFVKSQMEHDDIFPSYWRKKV